MHFLYPIILHSWLLQVPTVSLCMCGYKLDKSSQHHVLNKSFIFYLPSSKDKTLQLFRCFHIIPDVHGLRSHRKHLELWGPFKKRWEVLGQCICLSHRYLIHESWQMPWIEFAITSFQEPALSANPILTARPPNEKKAIHLKKKSITGCTVNICPLGMSKLICLLKTFFFNVFGSVSIFW